MGHPLLWRVIHPVDETLKDGRLIQQAGFMATGFIDLQQKVRVESSLIRRRDRQEGRGGLVYLGRHTQALIFDGLLGTKQGMCAYMCSTKAFLRDRSV